MPSYRVTDPASGQSLKITGDSPPTEQELEEIFASAGPAILPQGQQGELQDESSRISGVGGPSISPMQPPRGRGFPPNLAGAIPRGQEGLGFPGAKYIEPAATMISGALAEIPAGLAGIAGMAGARTPSEAPEAGAKAVEATREALTYIPRTTTGMAGLQAVGETLEPVAEALTAAEKGLGRAGYEAGGPLLGAAGEAAPTAGLISLGFGPVRRVLGITKTAEAAKKLFTPSARKLLKASAPTIEGLKSAAREVYKQIDDTGAVVNQTRISRLSKELAATARKEGFNRRIHPKVSAALDEFASVEGTPQSVMQLDTLRKVTRAAAGSIEPSEARLGAMLIEHIDDFLDNVRPDDFVRGKQAGVGPLYRDARQLWGRAKKAELLDDAFTKAGDQASGFENGIRVQFRSILNNKKKLRGFSAEEIDAMRKVVRGGPMENTAKALGKFGFTEGQATSMLLGSLGVAGGVAVGGPAGGVAVPLIGQVSKSLAQKLTRGNAEFAKAVTRAGRKGPDLVEAYLKHTTKAEINAAELAELLLRPEVNLKALKSSALKLPKAQRKLVGDAIYLATFLQSQKENEGQQ